MRKKRGCPHTTLTNTLVAYLKRHNIKDISEAINIANDRKQWRDIFRLWERMCQCHSQAAPHTWNLLIMMMYWYLNVNR